MRIRNLLIMSALVALMVPMLALGASADENTNSVAYWCSSEEGGTKYEPVDTPFIVPAPAEDTVWWVLILKAGSGDNENERFEYPVTGQGYTHSSGHNNSHAILCWENIPDFGSTTTVADTTTTVADTTTTVADTTTTVADTTTTVADTTTTTEPIDEPVTTTTEGDEIVIPDPTTTTLAPVTTTTTTVAPATTSTVQPCGPNHPDWNADLSTCGTLPVTGINSGMLLVVALTALVGGGFAIWKTRTN